MAASSIPAHLLGTGRRSGFWTRRASASAPIAWRGVPGSCRTTPCISTAASPASPDLFSNEHQKGTSGMPRDFVKEQEIELAPAITPPHLYERERMAT